jgi:hypothetical protein
MLHVVLFGYMLLFYRNVTSALGENFVVHDIWVSCVLVG